MKKSFKNMSFSNQVFYIFNSVFWILALLIILYPLYLVCIASVSDPDAVLRGEVTWRPIAFSLVGYKAVFADSTIWLGYLNSLFYTISSVCIGLFVTMTAAYAMSRKKLPGKKYINLYIILTMFLNGGLIPTFLIMRDLGLYDTRLVLILRGCFGVWNLMLARTYMQTTIPEELYEAAVLDGASHFQYFSKVVMPLSKTITAVLSVYYGVAKWNDYFSGVVYIRNEKLLPLQTVLRRILASLQVNLSEEIVDALASEIDSIMEAMRIANASKYCVIIISSVPAILLFMCMQKYFEKGVMIGSLKG